MDEPWANSTSVTGLDLHLDVDAGLGRRAGLEAALRAAIRTGRLEAGARLPASRALAQQLVMARGTVTAAYDQLVAEGFLVAGQGSGTVVAELSAADQPSWSYDEPIGQLPLDLRPGSPDVGGFPVTEWIRSARRALTDAPVSALGYGDPRGLAAVRAEVASYLGRTRGVVATPGDVVVTTGYVQALHLLARAVGSGPVAMENPNLARHRDVVGYAGRPVISIPVDASGADPAGLTSTSADLAVVTPAHQFPLGVAMAPERRHALLAWARASGGYVVEDDYDGEFRYDRQPVGALQGVSPDRVVYVGTTSKALAPGLRIGWMVVPRNIQAQVTDAKQCTDGQTSAIVQLAVADLLRSHAYDRHVRSMRLRYRRRRDLLLDVLQRRTSRHARGMIPASIAAGLQAVIRLPDEQHVIERAARDGLALSGLAELYHDESTREHGLVVGFAKPTDGRYREALDVLARALP